MSGRIRSIKPEWLEDELSLCSSDARVLSVALLLLADDHGNGRAHPNQLASQVFPGDLAKCLETLAKAREELERLRFALFYELDGQRYFHVRNWDKHQKVDKPGKPRVPGPPQDCSGTFAVAKPLETLEKVIETLATDQDHDLDQDHDQRPVSGPVAPRREEPKPSPVDFTDSDQLTLCPPDLHERAERLGVLAELAGKLKVPVESLRVEAKSYVTHFVMGAGIGEKGNRWMKRLRGQLVRRAQANELTPPGALEHARRGRLAPAEPPAFDALALGREVNAKMEAENQRRRAAAQALRQANDGK